MSDASSAMSSAVYDAVMKCEQCYCCHRLASCEKYRYPFLAIELWLCGWCRVEVEAGRGIGVLRAQRRPPEESE